MAENILTEPLMQNAEMLVLSPRSIIVPANTWTPVLGTQPLRVSASFIPTNWNEVIRFSPVAFGTAVFGATSIDPFPPQLHFSVFPLLIAGIWQCFSVGGQTLIVYETIRTTG